MRNSTAKQTAQYNSLTGFDWMSVSESYARLYDTLDDKFESVYTVAANRLANFADITESETIIEIGCGTGISTGVLATLIRQTARVFAFDISPRMLHIARQKLGTRRNLRLIEWDAYRYGEFVKVFGLAGAVDVTFSSFTYYYLSAKRTGLHSDVFESLAPRGKWAFNITAYLEPMCYGDDCCNDFGYHYRDAVDSILRGEGFPQGIGDPIHDTTVLSIDQEIQRVRDAGFSDVSVEPFELPMCPSKAVEFTVEGFYRFGSNPTFSETLCTLSVEKRLDVMRRALATAAGRMDASGEKPTVFNIVASK